METIEQKLRGAYNKLTGRLATSDQAGYFAFCKGVEYGIAEEHEAIAEKLNILRMTFNNGEEFEGDDGMIACVDLAQWNEGHRIIMDMLNIEQGDGS